MAEPNPLEEVRKVVEETGSLVGAAMRASQHAQIYGTGIIIRTKEGFYEAPNPEKLKITIVPDDGGDGAVPQPE